MRALIKASEAQTRGFARGHMKARREPITKATNLALDSKREYACGSSLKLECTRKAIERLARRSRKREIKDSSKQIFLIAQAIDLIMAFASGPAAEEQSSVPEHAVAELKEVFTAILGLLTPKPHQHSQASSSTGYWHPNDTVDDQALTTENQDVEHDDDDMSMDDDGGDTPPPLSHGATPQTGDMYLYVRYRAAELHLTIPAFGRPIMRFRDIFPQIATWLDQRFANAQPGPWELYLHRTMLIPRTDLIAIWHDAFLSSTALRSG